MSKTVKNSEYQKLTQTEHVLRRSETYVGSMIATEESLFTVGSITNGNYNIVRKNVQYVPAFLKIFDEIITNASDHSIRTKEVKSIKVTLADDHIIVENDGPSIPIKKHESEKGDNGKPVWIPEMIFFHLLSGSNFNDSEDRFVGGRNGLGSKLCNIFSNSFLLETCDGTTLYKQISDKNLSKINEPKITKKATKSFTRITFYPDFERFGMTKLDDDTRSLLMKRILDVAAYCPDVKVTINDVLVPIRTMKDYMKMHLSPESEVFYEQMTNGWDIGVAQSTTELFQQVSIVNGITTYRGGTHVNRVSLDLSNELKDQLLKGNKKINITWKDIKDKLFVFLICRIPNPTFDTQTKENLTNRISKEIYQDAKISPALIKKIMKSEIVESILNFIAMKNKQELSKLNKSLQKIKVEKLIDAKGKDRTVCSCRIFEGDSAISAFRKFREPSTMGAFPIRGKFMNVSELTTAAIMKNEEVKNLVSALGLSVGEKYNAKNLRYGNIYVSTDSDKDGDGICGLLINFFYRNWKELFDEGRVYKVLTPLLVAQKGKVKEYFYTENEFSIWCKKNDPNQWELEYKKGLASLVDEEYQMIIREPRLLQLTSDDAAKQNLDIWFGKDSQLRKDKLNKQK